MRKLKIYFWSLLFCVSTLSASDVGITMVQSPAPYSFLELDSSYTVQVFLFNFGNDTITSVPLIYQVGYNDTLAETFNGIILPGSGTSFTFASQYTITDTVSFYGQAKTELAGDSNSINDSYLIVYNKPSAVTDDPEPIDLSIYPNPSNGQFNIQTQKANQLVIVDISGKVRKQLFIESGDNTINIDLPNGLYQLVEAESGKSRSIIIQR